jgi:uncharacterized membrane protein
MKEIRAAYRRKDMKKEKKERPPFQWGKNPCCNRIPERAPHIGNFCFPLCYRCLGAVFGMAATCILHGTGYLHIEFGYGTMGWMILLSLPAFFHHRMENKWGIRTRNRTRFVTGLLLGFAIEIPLVGWLFYG